MAVRVSTIVEKFPELLRPIRGDMEIAVSRPRAPSAPVLGCILFLNRRRLIDDAVNTAASALVISDADLDHDALTNASQTLLQSPNPELALALVARTFFPIAGDKEKFEGERIHPSAVIAASAQIADDTVIGPNTVVGSNVRIGGSCVIGANTTVEADAEIGDGTHIHANVFIGHRTVIGKRCEIHPMTTLGTEGYGYAHDAQFNHYRHVHYGRLVIEDDVHVGGCVTIDRGHFVDSVIGRGTKIDSHCHLGHNIRVGNNCLMTGGFMASGSVVIGDNNIFGGRTGISDHVTIGDDMQFAARSSIYKDVDEPGRTFGGEYRLQPLNEYLKTSASFVHLPEIRRNVARIMRKLGMRKD